MDGCAWWTAFYTYSTNYLIDLEAGIIVDVDVEAERQRLSPRRRRLSVSRNDSAYDAAPLLGWMGQDKKIAPHVRVWDKAKRKDGSLEISDFTWDP